MNIDDLPPTQYLVLEVLAGRARTGERTWTFPSRLIPALRALEDAGLIWWKHGSVYRTCLAGLTDEGRAAAMPPDSGYLPPLTRDLLTLCDERVERRRVPGGVDVYEQPIWPGEIRAVLEAAS